MNKEQIEQIINILMMKSDFIRTEIKHELISLAQPELNEVQYVVIDNAIKGALITGMKTTIEKILSK